MLHLSIPSPARPARLCATYHSSSSGASPRSSHWGCRALQAVVAGGSALDGAASASCSGEGQSATWPQQANLLRAQLYSKHRAPQSAAAPSRSRQRRQATHVPMLLLILLCCCRRLCAAVEVQQQRQGRAQCRSLRRRAQQRIRCSARRPSCPSCSRATNASRGACEPGAQVPGQPRSGGRRAPRQHLRRLRFGQPRHSLPLPRGSVRPRRDITWRDESLSRLPAVL